MADTVGVWGVSLLVVYPSALLGNALSRGVRCFRDGWKRCDRTSGNLRGRFRRRGRLWPVHAGGRVEIAAVEGCPRPAERGSVEGRIHRLPPVPGRASERQSRKAITENPEIVIWSETSFVPAIDWHTRYRPDTQTYGLVKELRAFLATQPVPYVVGNDDGQLKRVEEDKEDRVDFNAAILFDKGRIVDTYRKLHLVPFTESFPFQKQLPGIYKWLKNADTHFWEKGTVYTVFDAGGVRFSTPDLLRGYLRVPLPGVRQRRAPTCSSNMTNDAWSLSVPCAMQHMTMAVFRAVENRRSVVRSTNGGMTNIIDPNGRILAHAAAVHGRIPLRHRARLTRMPRLSTRAWGDWFPWLLLALSVAGLAVGGVRRVARSPPRDAVRHPTD